MANHHLDANQCIQEAFDPVDGGLKTTSPASTASTPTIENIVLPNANEEAQFPLPLNTKQFTLRVRDSGAKLQLAFNQGMSSSKYITLERGCSFNQIGVSITDGFLFFQVNKPNQVVEILIWT